MNTTTAVRDLLDTTDDRVTGRIGDDHLFTGECDHCTAEPAVLIEVTTSLRRGATREGHIYCLAHGRRTVDTLSWASDADDIAITVPAYLADLAAAAALDTAA